MPKQIWKPGTVLYPVPVVMVSCGDMEHKNIFTAAWTGTINTNPPMTYVSIRPERHSHALIQQSGEFVINLVTKDLAYACDYCGVKSGRDVDKFAQLHLTAKQGEKSQHLSFWKAQSTLNVKSYKYSIWAVMTFF